MLDEAAAWRALEHVLDPEVPVLSVVELGIVRGLSVSGSAGRETVEVTLTPTYSGCPATELIEAEVVQALEKAGATEVKVKTRLSPPWTTDWLAPTAHEKLRAYGIAPPHVQADAAQAQPLRFHPRSLVCPRCGSKNTQQLSAFGSTACKAIYRCLDCREPFEHFKPI